MGKHSAPQQAPFYRSIVVWLLPWVLIAAVVVIAVWIAIDAVGRDDEKLVPAAQNTRTPVVIASATPDPTPVETPEPVETKRAEPKKKKNEPKPDRTADQELITEDITIQVLNATGDPGADDRMADRLSSLGYEVVSIQGSSKEYSATTVFWSFPEAREAAERLAAKFGWRSGPKPSNLSSTADLHVVVGNDEL
ncbi:MAG TPA: LytR C-terminal domain-containing protein [Actinomycetota bacterium]|nr:LytR C-terminal domain-containing protein [Actinomycetota bacterium]